MNTIIKKSVMGIASLVAAGAALTGGAGFGAGADVQAGVTVNSKPSTPCQGCW